jgi:DNA polymerase III delta prime subunit
MAHHAYFFAGNAKEGIEQAKDYAIKEIGISPEHNSDLLVLSYGIFSVEDARSISDMAERAPTGGASKVLIISAPRIFHQAQNALLKIFEEPPAGVTLILIIPSEGILLPTLRSRLLPLPSGTKKSDDQIDTATSEFIDADSKGREKIVSKLIEKTKSDKEDEKQVARTEATQLIEGLLRTAYQARTRAKAEPQARELTQFLADLDRFIPILHERSAPLKLIFEHILLTIPTSVS